MTWCTYMSVIPNPTEDFTSSPGHPWSGSFRASLSSTKGWKMTTSSPQGHGTMVSTAQPKRESQVGYLRVRFLSKTLQILQSSSYSYYSLFGFILMMGFRELTMTLFLVVIANRRHIAPRLSFTNVAALKYLLRSEIFVSKDRQLPAIHLILDFEPISRTFQEIGHTIRARDP